MQLSLVEDFIRQLKRRYKIRQVAFDPSYFGRSAQELEREGFTMVEFTPAGAPTRAAWQSFYQAAKEGTLTHDGDPVLAAHVEAAAAERTEHGLKVRKLKSSSRIDALAAAVLAHASCQLAKKRAKTTIYWMEL
jgi:phage terminase large subunit-like protein